MQSRNKREGYYFGKAFNWNNQTQKILSNGHTINNYGKRRHKRIKEWNISLTGYFKLSIMG